MSMTRGHMYALTLSDNWGHYQVLINELRSRFTNHVRKIAHAWWNQTVELTAKYKPSDGWRFKSACVKRSNDNADKFEIHVTLTRQNGYRVIESSHPDDYWGFGGPPEHLKEHIYEDAIIVVPAEFIEAAKFENDIPVW